MRYPGRRGSAPRTTICISSQAGCAVGCPFCATGQAGFGRQLTPGEIVDQVLHWHRDPWLALGADWRPGAGSGHYNIVFMGMGEPLNNTDRVFEAVRLLNDPERLGIGARHITVSTSGVVPGIDRMIEELPQVNLAISLHAADDALRDELVPLNRKWPLGGADGGGTSLRRANRTPGEPRVRDDRRRERQPGAGRAPGRAGRRLAQPRQPHPAEPDARLALERHAAGPRRAPSPACSARPACRPRCATRAAARSRRPAASCTRSWRAATCPSRRRGAGASPRSWRDEPPPAADQRQHPECRLRPAGRGGASRRRRRRGLDPPGRHGRPLRATTSPWVRWWSRRCGPHSQLPFHSHLMISRPLRVRRRPSRRRGATSSSSTWRRMTTRSAVIGAIRAAGRQAGLAINPETPAEAAHPYLDRIDMLLVMTVNPGWGGQPFMTEVLPKLAALRGEAEARGLDLPIGVDGGVNLETIGSAYAAGGDVLVTGKALYASRRRPATGGRCAARRRARHRCLHAHRRLSRIGHHVRHPHRSRSLTRAASRPIAVLLVLATLLAACGDSGLPFVPSTEPTAQPPRELTVIAIQEGSSEPIAGVDADRGRRHGGHRRRRHGRGHRATRRGRRGHRGRLRPGLRHRAGRRRPDAHAPLERGERHDHRPGRRPGGRRARVRGRTIDLGAHRRARGLRPSRRPGAGDPDREAGRLPPGRDPAGRRRHQGRGAGALRGARAVRAGSGIRGRRAPRRDAAPHRSDRGQRHGHRREGDRRLPVLRDGPARGEANPVPIGDRSSSWRSCCRGSRSEASTPSRAWWS